MKKTPFEILNQKNSMELFYITISLLFLQKKKYIYTYIKIRKEIAVV